MLTSTEPTDVWHELCWRLAVVPGVMDGRGVDIVFAVYTRRWSPPIRTAVVDAVTGELLDTDGRSREPGPGKHEPDPVPCGQAAQVGLSKAV